MKKICATLAFSVVALFATTMVNIHSGWNLVGAIGAIKPNQISCAKTVWGYENGKWKLYVKGSTDANNYGYDQFSSIQAGEGFWVNAGTNSCDIDFSNLSFTPTEGKTFFLDGLVFVEKKSNAAYTIPGNSVSYNENNQTFTLKAVKNTVSDSRSGIKIGNYGVSKPFSLVEATLNLQTANTTSSANRAQLNIGRIPLANIDANATIVKVASSGVILSSQGIDVWVDIDFSDGTWKDIYDQKVSNESMVGKNVKVKALIEGKKIKYEFSGGYKGELTIDTATLTYNDASAEINGGIGYAEFRSRVKVASDATDTSVVTVSDIKVAPYIKELSGVTSNTASLSTLPDNFIITDAFTVVSEEQPGYMSVTKSASTFSVDKYDLNGSNWQKGDNFSGNVDGNILTLPDSAEKIKFEIYHTQKVNGYSDLYMHFEKNTVLAAPNSYKYDNWDWTNPSYYDPTTKQSVQITDLNSLITGFTTRDDQGGGIYFEDNTIMFLNQDPSSLPVRRGNVVTGRWNGQYYNWCTDGDCKVFTRTDNVVGTWSEDAKANEIKVETSQEDLIFKVQQDNSGEYRIVEGDRDKVGRVDYDIIFSGDDATDENIRNFLTPAP